MPPKRILIVEDEAVVALDIQNRLTQMGYEVAGVVGRGDEALALAIAAQPDLVLMDIRLKGEMDGIAAADQIRQNCCIPVVFLTAFSEDHTLQRAKVAEPLGYIIKPFEDRDINATIEMALYKHQSEQRYRLLFESNPHPLWVYDLETLAFLAVNDAAVAHYGYSRDEFLSMTIKDIRPSEDIDALLAKVAAVTNGLDRAGLWRHRLKNGRIIEVDITSHTLLFGNRRAELVLAQDVTERRQMESALQQANMVIENSPAVLFRWKAAEGWPVTMVSRNVSQFGYSTEELLSGKTPFAAMVHPEDLDRVAREVANYTEEGAGRFRQQYRIVTKDGEVRWVDDLTLVERRPDGRVAFYQGIVIDITERIKAEEKERESANLLSSIYRAAPTGIGVVSDRVLITVNDRICKMTGYGREELIGKNARVFYPSDADYEYVGTEKYRQIRERGTGTVETHWQRIDGRIIDVLLSSTPINPMDLSAGVTFTALDITDRKHSAKKMRRSHQTLLAVLDGIDATIYVADMQSHDVLFMNRHMIDAFGGDFTGRPCHEAFRRESSPCSHCTNDRLLDADGRPTGVCVWEAQNPITGKWYINHDRAIRWVDGRTVRLQIATDITHLKQMEQERSRIAEQFVQAQKMESVGRLAGGVAHDFNNMLGVIIGHAELGLLGLDPSEPICKTLKNILKAAQRSAELTQQLLAFARKQTVAPKVLDLNDTMAGMLKMLQRLIGEDIAVLWKPGAGLWPVKLDPSQIDQILANLCVNARDAIDGVGKLTIETKNTVLDDTYCAVHPGFVPGHFVMLAVSDNGCGMDKQLIEHLFEPFFTTKEVGKGTGLGLATVYGIVKQNDGFINVYSEPGKGSTFKIYLPRFAGQPIGPIAESLPPAPKAQGETVLLVEDEKELLTMSKAMLEALGYAVISAGTPGDALHRARAHAGPIHLLITDVVMPEMNGRDLARSIRDVTPAIKCLFMSGYTANVIAHHGVLDEGVLFLQKPFSINDLAFKVREALEGR